MEDAIQAKVINNAVGNASLNTRDLHFGQVINNQDPQNLNRIQIRIPIVDENFYVGRSKEEGDALLPWCVPMSNRFYDVPEVNAVVLVKVFDVKTPHLGRMYFESFSTFSQSDYFDRLTPETTSLSNWNLVEDIFNIQLNFKPKPNEYNAPANINYKTGIRGKGNNKVLLDKEQVEISQNLNSDQSVVRLSKNIDVDSSDVINITSKKSKSETYNPVFDDPLFEYLSAMNKMIKQVVTLLNTIPANSPVGPCTPGPNAGNLINDLKSMSKAFDKFKRTGSSEKININ